MWIDLPECMRRQLQGLEIDTVLWLAGVQIAKNSQSKPANIDSSVQANQTFRASSFESQLDILMALLSQRIDRSTAACKSSAAQPLFLNLLDTWEALSAAEAEKAAEDAKLFKNKIKDTTIQTEEVRTSFSGNTGLLALILDLFLRKSCSLHSHSLHHNQLCALSN